MSNNIKQYAIKSANILSIQLDKTTAVSKEVRLMVYVGNPGQEEMEQDIL